MSVLRGTAKRTRLLVAGPPAGGTSVRFSHYQMSDCGVILSATAALVVVVVCGGGGVTLRVPPSLAAFPRRLLPASHPSSTLSPLSPAPSRLFLPTGGSAARLTQLL